MAPISKISAWKTQQDISSVTLDAMRHNQVLTDVTLVCGPGRHEFSAHRFHLCSASPYFMAMFQSGMKEASTGRVEMNGITADAMSAILNFVYNGSVPEVEAAECRDDLRHLLYASNLMQIHVLFNYCLQQFASQMSVDCFLEQWKMAEMYCNEELLRRIPQLLAISFRQIAMREDFFQMSASQLTELLAHPDMQVDPADVVVKGILDWIRYDEEERVAELGNLMAHVDYGRISRECIDALLTSECLIETNAAVRSELFTRRMVLQDPLGKRLKLVCFGTDFVGRKTSVSTYDVADRKFQAPKEVVSFPMEQGMAVCAYGTNIFFAGGGKSKLHVYRYSPLTNAAHYHGDLLCAVHNGAGSEALDGLIYVVDGNWVLDTDSRRPGGGSSVQRFNPWSGSCEQLASTNESFMHPFVFTVCSQLYVCWNELGILEQYSVLSDKWSVVTREPGLNERAFFFPPVATVCAGKLFIVRSLKPRGQTFRIHDFETGAWETRELGRAGPGWVSGLWSVVESSAENQKTPFILVRDGANNVLYAYNVEGDSWVSTAEKNDHFWDSDLTVVMKL